MDPVEKVEIEEKVLEEKVEEKVESKQEKDDFEKDSEVVPSGKYNAAVRKQRELELANRELEKKLSEREIEKPVKKEIPLEEDEDEEDEDFFEKKKIINPDIIEPISKELNELKNRIDMKEEDDRKKQRSTFFKTYPQYLNSSEKFQELLDEMDNSLNPNSKDGYYKQLVKAHRILNGDTSNIDIEKKKAQLASEMSSNDDQATKTNNRPSKIDERSKRLASRMPKGYEFKQ